MDVYGDKAFFLGTGEDAGFEGVLVEIWKEGKDINYHVIIIANEKGEDE